MYTMHRLKGKEAKGLGVDYPVEGAKTTDTFSRKECHLIYATELLWTLWTQR